MKFTGNKRYGTEHTNELAMTLLSASPLERAQSNKSLFGNDDDIEDVNKDKEKGNEATTFDAETHISHMKDVFSYYGVNVTPWVVCQVADSASVNVRIARILQVPHVACLNNSLILKLT